MSYGYAKAFSDLLRRFTLKSKNKLCSIMLVSGSIIAILRQIKITLNNYSNAMANNLKQL